MFKMAKKSKLSTPTWILEGYNSPEEYNKSKGISKKKDEKTFKISICPKCGSDEVSVVEGTEKGEWECKKCKWKGTNIIKKELTEEEFMRYLDEKNIEVPDENSFNGDFKKEIIGGEEE